MKSRILLLILAIFPSILPLALASAPPMVAGEKETAPRVVILLIDNSGSILELPVADTMRSFVVHLAKVAALSPRRIKLVAILYDGNGVEVVGDPNDVVDGLEMPTATHDTFLHRLLTEWKEPNGGTPLDLALNYAAFIASEQPAESDVTVVSFGDGTPWSGFLRPDDFPEVREAMDQKVQAILDGPFADAIKQGLIERVRREWEDASSDDGKRIREIQRQAEYRACLENADHLLSAAVRYVTVDFAGIPALREIHVAAGGEERDYVLLDDPAQVIGRLHLLGLTQFEGVVAPEPIMTPPTEEFEAEHDVAVDPFAERLVLTIALNPPIDNAGEDAVVSVDVDGSVITFDGDGDPNAIRATDGKGRMASLTLCLDAAPESGVVSVRFESPQQSHKVPGATIYLHVALSTDLVPVFRPINADVDQKPPYVVSDTHALPFEAAILGPDQLPIPVAQIDVVLRSTRGGDALPITMAEEPSVPGLFLSAQPVALPIGTYDVEFHYVLPSGVPLQVVLHEQIVCQRQDEHVTLELTDDVAKKAGHVALKQIGDEQTEGVVNVLVRLANVDYPVSLRASIVGLQDAQGNEPNAPILTIPRDRFVVQPGRPTKLAIRYQVPPRLDGVVDGPFEATLAFMREDQGEPIDVRPFVNADFAVDPVNLIRFTLRRPGITLEAPRIFGDEIVRSGSEVRVEVHADVWAPYGRDLRVVARHDSQVARTLRIDPRTPFIDADGREYESIAFTLVEGDARQEVEPGREAEWRFRVEIPDQAAFERVTADVVVAGEGLRTVTLPVEIVLRDPLLAPRIEKALWGLFAAALVLGVAAFVRHVRARRFDLDREFVAAIDRPFIFIEVDEKAILLPGGDVWMQTDGDRRFRKAPSRIPLRRLSEGRRLLLAQPNENGEPGLTLAIESVETDAEGNPVLAGSVQDPGPYVETIARHRRRWKRRLAAAAALFLIAASAYAPAVVHGVQLLLDTFRA